MIWPILLDGPEHCYGPSKNKTSKRPGRQVVAGPHRHGNTTKHAASTAAVGWGLRASPARSAALHDPLSRTAARQCMVLSEGIGGCAEGTSGFSPSGLSLVFSLWFRLGT